MPPSEPGFAPHRLPGLADINCQSVPPLGRCAVAQNRLAAVNRRATHVWPRLAALAIAACLSLLPWHQAAALEQVSLQLKWKHQFQFAGYYQALEQGFYRDAGLDVAIREAVPISTSPKRLPAAMPILASATSASWANGRRAGGWSFWLLSSSTPRPSFWCRAGPTSAACRNCAAAR